MVYPSQSPVSPCGEVPQSGKGCTRQSTGMILHDHSDRQTAACFAFVYLYGTYPPAPLRHFVALFPSRGRKGWRRSPFFHLYPIKIAFSQKFRLPVGIFLLFRKISCMQKILGIKKDRRAGLFPFHSSQKLLIRPMLMRGRASRSPSSVNRPGAAAEAEYLCRQRRKSTLYCPQGF